jgi:hypothetical protein
VKLFITLAFTASALLLAAPAISCTDRFRAPVAVLEAIQLHGGWPISEVQCAFLKKRDLKVQVTATSTVLVGVSIAWSAVRLSSHNNVVSDIAQASTMVNSEIASMDTANGLMVLTLKDNISSFDFELAAKQIADYRAVIKKNK